MRVRVLLSLLGCVPALVRGHISLSYPCPRFSPTGENCPSLPKGQQLDQEMNAPLSSIQQGYSKPLCKYTTPWPTPAAKWTAGQSVTVKFGQHAVSHSGGHCEFSLSYDGGKTFVVIHQELQYCFTGANLGITNEVKIFSYTFTLPKDLPGSDKAVFAWSWVNASGNREFYMNCADVAISGTSKSFTGKQMTIANYKGYPTIPEFNGNYNTGLDLYKKDIKTITVNGDGSGGSDASPNPPSVPSKPEPSSDPGKDKPTSSSAKPKPTAAPQPTAVPQPTVVPQPSMVPQPSVVPKPNGGSSSGSGSDSDSDNDDDIRGHGSHGSGNGQCGRRNRCGGCCGCRCGCGGGGGGFGFFPGYPQYPLGGPGPMRQAQDMRGGYGGGYGGGGYYYSSGGQGFFPGGGMGPS
ncbi:hypothetical protein H4R19_001958 [Coemansia spiralis]|nr:hypothetical protein H4R19_001958 [Coemansia spiralis]